MKNYIKLGLFPACFISTVVTQTAVSQNIQKPNIVFILADDLGWTDLGAMGSDFYETPNIDRLAKEGILFDNAYASAANSAPSRACLMSGQYTPRHGVYTVSPPDRGDKTKRKFIATKNNDDLKAEFTTIAETLQDQGYQCAHIGKWHLGDDVEGTGPLSQGFIHNVGGRKEGTPYSYFYPYCNQNKCLYNLDKGVKGEYLTDRLTNEAISFIEKNQDKPFFVYLAHHAVHTPLQAPDSLITKYTNKHKGKRHSNAKYAAMIEALDNSVGKVYRRIEELGLSENTIIVFYSDNGGLVPITDNYPLRAGKGSPYEGGIRVPLIIKWKGSLKAGIRSSALVTGVDFFPTFMSVSKSNFEGLIDGENIVDLLESGNESRDLFWHFPAYLESYTDSGRGFRAKPYSIIRSGHWKLILNHEDTSTELYNLEQDISESINLSNQEPETRDKLLNKLNLWIKSVQAPIPAVINPYYIVDP